MTVKTILSILTTDVTAPHLAAVSAALAARCQAHLTGLCALPTVVFPTPVAQHVTPAIIAAASESQEAEAATLRDLFETATKAEDITTDWHTLRIGGHAITERIVAAAHAADLVMIPSDDPRTDRADLGDLAAALIRGAGRPVLVVPPEAPRTAIGDSVVIGWSGTREATRAAFDTLALLTPGADVTFLTVTHSGAPDAATTDGAQALAQIFLRHGHTARIAHRVTGGKSVAECLLQEAQERSASFIATGAFGHSRTYDFIVGAATRELLTTLTLPVLFSK